MLCRRWFLVAAALVALLQVWQPGSFAQQNPTPDNTQIPPAPAPDRTEIVIEPAEANPPSSAPAPGVAVASGIKIPNFASCPIAELQHTVPGLAHLKADEDQSQLGALLEKIGAETVEIARKTPDLISDEVVTSVRNGSKTRQNFSFLVLQRGRQERHQV